MNQLSKLQHTFQGCVLAAGKSDEHQSGKASTAWISANGRAVPETQLSLYSYAYVARLKEVLANDFPAVLMAIGNEHFNQLADDYIDAHPSHYFSLRDFGRQLPDFVSELIQKHKDYQDMHWLHELAIFEWTLGQAFDAADATLFTEQDMATIPPEAWPELKFTLHPSVCRLNFEWNTPEMWQALTDDDPKQITAQPETTSAWLIWREQLTTRFRSMQNDEQLALDKLREGANFNDICETLATLMNENEVPLRVATLLKGWIAQDLIRGVQ